MQKARQITNTDWYNSNVVIDVKEIGVTVICIHYNNKLPATLEIMVALNSDIGFVWGFTISCQNRADKLLRPDDNVLKFRNRW